MPGETRVGDGSGTWEGEGSFRGPRLGVLGKVI